jgi:hypothetical protein
MTRIASQSSLVGLVGQSAWYGQPFSQSTRKTRIASQNDQNSMVGTVNPAGSAGMTRIASQNSQIGQSVTMVGTVSPAGMARIASQNGLVGQSGSIVGDGQ